MEVDINQWIQFSGNVAGGLIVVYWLVDTIRNWGGSPELKALNEEMRQTHEHLKSLIEKL